MRPSKINDNKLLRLIDRENMNQTEAAKKLGVTKQAVNKRLQELKGKTTKAIVAKDVKQIVSHKMNSLEQLKGVNKKTLELLDEAEDNPQLALKCIAEIRNQVRLSMDIHATLYSLKAAEEFQKIVLEVIKGVDADVCKEIIRRLNSERSVRSALRFA